MTTKPANLEQTRAAETVAKLADYWVLTKPEVNLLVVISALVGFFLGTRGSLDLMLLIHTMLGTLLVASGTATLNQYMERDDDAHMRRTSRRPLPAGRMAPWEALAFGLLLAAAGGSYLWLAANPLASFLALFTLATYLLIYTPLKKKTPWCTFIGAFPGAMPPLIGWAAARGSLNLEAGILYAILFLWQFPHFLSIAWMYREDYARAGLKMLPEDDTEGRSMGRQIFGYSLALVPVSLLPSVLGQVGFTYLFGALVMGLIFAYCGARLAVSRSNVLAKRLLLASVVYLPLVFALMMIDKR
ncbi:MAG: protoheme IX farnesyltransferase [Acidobacteria bacterium]|nr:protoheme IX farnesyltransferase [Acidobacteriota bacterium]